MPYYLEKGPIFSLIETYINRPHPGKWAILRALRKAEYDAASPSKDPNEDTKWLVDKAFRLWDDPAILKKAPDLTDHIIEHWFGFDLKAATHTWTSPDPQQRPETGEWIGYRGDVLGIVRRTIRWALEVSLGLMPDEDGPGLSPPAQIEFFWICGVRWFEGWVVQRPVGHDQRLVTVIFLTPPHNGAEVSLSPIATIERGPTRWGHAAPTKQNDYERVRFPAATPPPPPPRPVAVDRPYATWVVTHQEHVQPGHPLAGAPPPGGMAPNNTAAMDLGTLDTPATLATYRGTGEIVVVSPSVPSGGVPYDRTVTV